MCIQDDNLADVPSNLADMNRRPDCQSHDIVNLVRTATVRMDYPHLFAQALKWCFGFHVQKKIIQKICERLNKESKRLGYRFTHCTHTHTTIVHRLNSLQYFSFFRAMNNRPSPNPKIYTCIQSIYKFKHNWIDCRQRARSIWRRLYLTFISIASNKWITSKASCTATDGIVINYFTECILAARIRTWICTFLLNACFVLRTFRTNYTFGTTLWRHSNIVGLTRANGMAVHFVAMTVWTAWRWFTRIRIWRWCS